MLKPPKFLARYFPSLFGMIRSTKLFGGVGSENCIGTLTLTGAATGDGAAIGGGAEGCGALAAGVAAAEGSAPERDWSDMAKSPSLELAFAECKDTLKNQKDSMAASNTRAGFLMGFTSLYVTATALIISNRLAVFCLAVLAVVAVWCGYMAYRVKTIHPNFNPALVPNQYKDLEAEQVKSVVTYVMLDLIETNSAVIAEKNKYVGAGLFTVMLSVVFVLAYLLFKK